jgi:hypothetical protein
MLRWPKRAVLALVKLFEPLQDIDVYIEDANDEVFYTHVLKRVAAQSVRIARVFALGGRAAVVGAAQNGLGSPRRCLYLIDGDLEWVLGRPAPLAPGLYRLEAYCIENLIIDEKAAAALLVEECSMMEGDAIAKLEWSKWMTEITVPLVELFAAFAASYHWAPAYATVSRSIYALCNTPKSGGLPALDPIKVAALRDDALREAELHAKKEDVLALFDAVRGMAFSRGEPIQIVSGKDHLLPMLDCLLRKHGCKLQRRTLRLRLGLKCNRDRFISLFDAMERAAAGIL